MSDQGIKDASKDSMNRDVFLFGLGLQACTTRSSANHLLFASVLATLQGVVLEGAKTCGKEIELEQCVIICNKDLFGSGMVKVPRSRIRWSADEMKNRDVGEASSEIPHR